MPLFASSLLILCTTQLSPHGSELQKALPSLDGCSAAYRYRRLHRESSGDYLLEDGVVELGVREGAVWSRRTYTEHVDEGFAVRRGRTNEQVYDFFTGVVVDQSLAVDGGKGDILLSKFDTVPNWMEMLVAPQNLLDGLSLMREFTVVDPTVASSDFSPEPIASQSSYERLYVVADEPGLSNELSLAVLSQGAIAQRIEIGYASSDPYQPVVANFLIESYTEDGSVRELMCCELVDTFCESKLPQASPGAMVMDFRISGGSHRNGRLPLYEESSLREVQTRLLSEEIAAMTGLESVALALEPTLDRSSRVETLVHRGDSGRSLPWWGVSLGLALLAVLGALLVGARSNVRGVSNSQESV